MSLDGRRINGSGSGEYRGKFGALEATKGVTLIARKKRSTSEELGIFFQRWARKIFTPRTYTRERDKYLRLLQENPSQNRNEIAKAISDRKVAIYVGDVSIEAIQKRLKKVEAEARADHGMPEDEREAIVFDRDLVRAARLGEGREDIVERQWNETSEDYASRQEEIRQEYRAKKEARELINRETKSLWSGKYAAMESDLQDLRKAVRDAEGKVQAWERRRAAIPLYKRVEKEVPGEFMESGDDGKRFSKSQIDARLISLRQDLATAKYALAEKSHEVKWLHDQKRFPGAVMERVNQMVDEVNGHIEEKYSRYAGLVDEDDDEPVINLEALKKKYAKWAVNAVRDFRQKTVEVTEKLASAGKKAQTEEAVEDLFARRVAGEALDRMLGLADSRKDFLDAVELYKEGEFTTREQDIVAATKQDLSGPDLMKRSPDLYEPALLEPAIIKPVPLPAQAPSSSKGVDDLLNPDLLAIEDPWSLRVNNDGLLEPITSETARESEDPDKDN